MEHACLRVQGRPPPGIITISGTSDNQEKPILMVAYNGENHVRLYELPAFTPRGVLTPVGAGWVSSCSGAYKLLTKQPPVVALLEAWQ